MRTNFLSGLAVAGLFLAQEAQAATLAQSYSSDCFGFSDLSESATNESVSAGGGGTTNTGTSICGNSGTGIAGGGYVGVQAAAEATSFGQRETSTVYARAAWFDTFEVTAPDDWAGGAIDVQVVFGLDAGAFANTPTNTTDNASAFADFELLLSAQSSRAGTTPWTTSYSDRWSWTEYGSDPSSRSVSRTFFSSALSVTPGTDVITLGIDFDVTAFASAPDGQFGITFDGLNTASLARNGPAFILPEGFLVTNAAANVFNNHWIDPRIGGPGPSPVPLPAGLPLLLAGLGSLWALRRRDRRMARGA